MKKQILIAVLICATPAFAQYHPVPYPGDAKMKNHTRLGNPDPFSGPEGISAHAVAAVKRYRHQHRKFQYFKNWKAAWSTVDRLAYDLEGMQMCEGAGDFMKNMEPMIVIGIDKNRVEVLYPEWSKRNGAHVIRGATVQRTKVGF